MKTFYLIVMPACLLAGIHVFICLIHATAWMPAKRHAGMTKKKPYLHFKRQAGMTQEGNPQFQTRKSVP